MNLLIGTDWRVTSDSYNFILQQYRKVESKGDEAESKFDWKTVGYFGKIEHLVNRILQEEIKGTEALALNELMQNIKSIEQKLSNITYASFPKEEVSQ